MTSTSSEVPHVDDAWLAPGSVLVGHVTIGPESSVWFGAVIRADLERISIGSRTNIQDGAVLHSDPGLPLAIGDGVSVGHRAVLHGCEIGHDVLIGMGATVLDGARIGTGSLVAAGAVVLKGTVVPPRSLVAGVPALVRRAVTDDELAEIRRNAATYIGLAARYSSGAVQPVVVT